MISNGIMIVFFLFCLIILKDSSAQMLVSVSLYSLDSNSTLEMDILRLYVPSNFSKARFHIRLCTDMQSRPLALHFAPFSSRHSP